MSEVALRANLVRPALSLDELLILRALAYSGFVNTAWVVNATELSKTRICRALWRLEKNGRVIREYDKRDRRVRLVTLSNSGESLWRSLTASGRSASRQITLSPVLQ